MSKPPQINQWVSKPAHFLRSQFSELAENLVVNDITNRSTQSDDFGQKSVETGSKVFEKNDLGEIFQSQSEQGLRCVQTDDSFLYNNVQSGRSNNQNQLAGDYVVNNVSTQSGLNQWTESSITEVAQMLALCDDVETLNLLRGCEIPSQIFKLAACQLPNVKRNQIREWVKLGNLKTG